MLPMIRISAVVLAMILAPASRAFAQEMLPESRDAEEVFDEVLSAHGEWHFLPPYGRVWRPTVAVADGTFVPYATAGHWTYTDLGWSFESDWEWGWLPFHYGRWLLTDVGWLWVPGAEWAPAWVDWRFGAGYVGWAPLPPEATVVEEVSMGWTYVELRYFLVPDLVVYVLPPQRVVEVHPRTTPVRVFVRRPGHRWYHGPPARWISSRTGVPLRPARIHPPGPGRIERPRVEPVVQPRRTPVLPGRVPVLERPGQRPLPPLIRPTPPRPMPAIRPTPRRQPPPPVIHRRPRPVRRERAS